MHTSPESSIDCGDVEGEEGEELNKMKTTMFQYMFSFDSSGRSGGRGQVQLPGLIDSSYPYD